MWISFNMTTEAIVKRAKTCTRRSWKASHAAKFKKGDQVDAYDKRPQWGGRKIAVIELLEDPKKSRYCDVGTQDWIEEGFDYMSRRKLLVGKEKPAEIFARWCEDTSYCYVIRFKIVRLIEEGKDG